MSSRLIVKNLPPYFTQNDLKKHFASFSSVTDAKLMTTKSGQSRQFGFIGYASHQEAIQAARHFNKTFIDTHRLVVEEAKAIGSDQLPRAWSKYSQGSSEYEKIHGKQQQGDALIINDANQNTAANDDQLGQDGNGEPQNIDDMINADPKLREFLQVMKPRSQKKIWENDDIEVLQNGSVMAPVDKSKIGGVGAVQGPLVKGGDDEDDYEDLPQQTSKDKVDSNDEVDGERPKDDANTQRSQNEETTKAANIADSGRLFVRNLCYTCTESDLTGHFARFGPISEVVFPLTKESKQSKGFAYVTYLIPENAVSAYSELDGTDFQGRLLHVLPAADKPSSYSNSHKSDAANGFKAKKSDSLRKSAANDTNSWNSLFMNQDAVNEYMAQKMNISKGEFLTADSDNLAVRQALAETHVIQETVKFFKDYGVDVDQFKSISSALSKRSDSVIMCKNLPYSTSETELRAIFERYGELLRFIIPPTKSMALIEFSSPSEAKQAFKSCAYRNFHGVPLLLEYAPVKIFSGPASQAQSSHERDVEQSAENQDELLTSTVYVKNLSFQTTEKKLMSVFAHIDGFRSVKISTKRDKAGKQQSMGFGFVEFQTKEGAKRAISELQNVMLDGHALQLKFSDHSSSKSKTVSARKVSELMDPENAVGTKLLVRNVPFEATKRDLMELFGTFAQLKSIKVPKKFDGSGHRGFAFVNFLTKQEAANAMESLSSTHLYGRKLVIEWAKEEDSVDALMQKTKRSYELANAAQDLHHKKSRVTLGSEQQLADSYSDSDLEE
ncbi:hypothetical protein MIR68_012313 [Amoeboaphelidium protococcarum]|nr:hypothetical protein MIR68_012313 [Amoeboaphelidium protococcarum]